MRSEQNDRRVAKTKRAIRSSLAKLLLEKDINEISVKDIAEKAEINRKTFYNHYDGIHQVLDEIEDEMVEKLEQSLRDLDIRNLRSTTQLIFNRLTDYVKEAPDYAPLLRLHKHSSLSAKIVASLQKQAVDSLRPQLPQDERALRAIVSFILAGLLSAYQDWYSADDGLPLKELSETIATLLIHGFAGFSK